MLTCWWNICKKGLLLNIEIWYLILIMIKWHNYQFIHYFL